MEPGGRRSPGRCELAALRLAASLEHDAHDAGRQHCCARVRGRALLLGELEDHGDRGAEEQLVRLAGRGLRGEDEVRRARGAPRPGKALRRVRDDLRDEEGPLP